MRRRPTTRPLKSGRRPALLQPLVQPRLKPLRQARGIRRQQAERLTRRRANQTVVLPRRPVPRGMAQRPVLAQQFRRARRPRLRRRRHLVVPTRFWEAQQGRALTPFQRLEAGAPPQPGHPSLPRPATRRALRRLRSIRRRPPRTLHISVSHRKLHRLRRRTIHCGLKMRSSISNASRVRSITSPKFTTTSWTS